MANENWYKSEGYWGWFLSGRKVGDVDYNALKSQLSINPEHVFYAPSPGEKALNRPLEDIVKVFEFAGVEFSQVRDDLMAVSEKKGKYTPSTTEPSVKTYYDAQGRVVKTEFVGDRGAIGTNGITNLYEFDQQGRLVTFNQMVSPKGGKKPKLFRGSTYEYIAGRPDNQYTEHLTDTEGKKKTITFENRQEKNKSK